ncbi:histidine phosphatase family protein [Ideonella sp. A 288]|uniref:histidine phosphatase family protein n=1 Tax=Ideonella sp. A 288 TaxID=1962181 RepID=UPI000B4BEFDB|nr:histidine phosphatase family protein [Ideonella sp. A 288]
MSGFTRLVAIRHGETAWNAETRLQGHTDIPLNAVGRAQAGRMADALRDEGLVRVVSSDLARAAETAQVLATRLGLPLTTDTGLRERCYGRMEGLTYREIDDQQPEWAARWRQRDPDFAPPGGESLRTFQARCVGAADRLARDHAGAAIALVTHGGVLDLLYRAATGIDLQAPRTWRLGNAVVNRLLHNGEGFVLVGWNDDRHLGATELDDTGG